MKKWWKRQTEEYVCRKMHLKEEKIVVTRDKLWAVDTGYGAQRLASKEILELDLTPQLEKSTQWRITALPDGTLMIIPNRFD